MSVPYRYYVDLASFPYKEIDPKAMFEQVSKSGGKNLWLGDKAAAVSATWDQILKGWFDYIKAKGLDTSHYGNPTGFKVLVDPKGRPIRVKVDPEVVRKLRAPLTLSCCLDHNVVVSHTGNWWSVGATWLGLQRFHFSAPSQAAKRAASLVADAPREVEVQDGDGTWVPAYLLGEENGTCVTQYYTTRETIALQEQELGVVDTTHRVLRDKVRSNQA